MNAQRISLLVTLLFTLGLLAPVSGGAGIAEARPSSSRSASKTAKAEKKRRRAKRARRAKRRRRRARRRARARKKKVCTRRRGKRRCRWVPRFSGHGVAKRKLRDEPLPEPSGEVWVYAVNFREEVKVDLYDDDGELDPTALAQLDDLFRCRRTGEERAVDPRLYEVLSIIYDHFGQRRIELISGFRNQPNQGSRHFHASAMDIRVPGVSARKLYRFATSLDKGGMGIGLYPTSGFVHVDWRAPGEKSYRWTDYSGPGQKSNKRRRRRRRRPNS